MKSLESMQSVDPAVSDESYGQGRQLAPPTILWGPPSTPRLQSYLDRLGIVLPEDYETEVNLAMEDWLKEAAGTFQKGLVLLIDYGRPAHEYYAPERSGGTLRCFRKHQVSDPFLSSSPAATGGGPMGPRLGHSGATSLDWTSDVDFTSLALDAREEGFVPLAFMEMGSFLLAGAELLLRNGTLEVPSPLEGGAMNGGLRYLLHPEGMGAAFHVLILGRNIDSAEWTFEHNRLRRLQLPAPSIRPPEWRPLIDGHRHPDEKGERR